MLDMFHTPTHGDVQLFPGARGAETTLVWQRPRGVSMLHILCLSFGGDGGSSLLETAAGGGGGGGSTGQTTLVVPAIFLPERLYIHHSWTNGVSWVSVYPEISLHANATLARAARGANGTGSTTGTGAAGGSGGAAATITNMSLAGLGRWHAIAGQSGTTGGSTGAGTNVTFPTTGLVVTGGAGGGGHGTGSGGAGGNVSGVAHMLAIAGGSGTATATVPAQDGQAGYNRGRPLVDFFCGGSGGGASHNNATGAGLYAGKGGDGGYGSGGGGAGGRSTGVAWSAGGLGGDALVIITGW